MSAYRCIAGLSLLLGACGMARAEPLLFELKVIDRAEKPIAGLPVRIVLSGLGDEMRRPDAGLRLVTDAQGLIRQTIDIKAKRRFSGLGVPFVSHRVRTMTVGMEPEAPGEDRVLYWIDIDAHKQGTMGTHRAFALGTDGQFSDELSFWGSMTRGAQPTFDRKPSRKGGALFENLSAQYLFAGWQYYQVGSDDNEMGKIELMLMRVPFKARKPYVP